MRDPKWSSIVNLGMIGDKQLSLSTEEKNAHKAVKNIHRTMHEHDPNELRIHSIRMQWVTDSMVDLAILIDSLILSKFLKQQQAPPSQKLHMFSKSITGAPSIKGAPCS
eukprot:TRINITY_DN18352_c0_g1_i1.p2 TRINITY_DN18352_c0_g1~~TRINITY_DN18352_c0_g1_i1.p2  ORF type:complete len:109 (+),score=13.06 TRINITY_DN18352_c0_g1_i1:611-937(+)